MAFRYSKDPQANRSLRHSLRDGVAHAVMSGGGETYLTAFALHLKASVPQIALLAALPPLLGSLAQLLSAWLGHHMRRRKPLIMAGAYLQALVWPLLVALPLLFPAYAIPLLLICITAYHATSSLVAPQWLSLMGDLVPERKRGRFFGLRTRLTSMTAFLSLVAAGIVLDTFDRGGATLMGFILIFAVATVARLVSTFHLGCMHEPQLVHVDTETPLGAAWFRGLRDTGALYFSAFFVSMQAAVAVASPFFVVYMLRDLKFTYLEFMANTGTAVLVQFLTLNTWGRISDIFGNRLILVATGSLIPILPALWLVSDNFWYLIGVQVIAGLGWAGFNLSAGNFLYDLVPSTRRATYMAMHNVFTAVGVFAGASLGGLLSLMMPETISLFGGEMILGSALMGLFLLSSLLRGLVSAIFLRRLKEVRNVRRTMSATSLVFRVTRFNAFSGLLYEVVTMFRRNGK